MGSPRRSIPRRGTWLFVQLTRRPSNSALATPTSRRQTLGPGLGGFEIIQQDPGEQRDPTLEPARPIVGDLPMRVPESDTSSATFMADLFRSFVIQGNNAPDSELTTAITFGDGNGDSLTSPSNTAVHFRAISRHGPTGHGCTSSTGSPLPWSSQPRGPDRSNHRLGGPRPVPYRAPGGLAAGASSLDTPD